MTNATTIEKLVILKRVTGFAAQGIMASPKYLGVAESYLGDLARDADAAGQAMELATAKTTIEALKMSVMPSMEICLKGMAEVDAYLRPLRQERRLQEAQAGEGSSPLRPRMH